MKFRAAFALSFLLHISIFAYIIISPAKREPKEMTYYVDIIHLSGTGGGSGTGRGARRPAGRQAAGGSDSQAQAALVAEGGKLSDLTAARQETPKSDLRYPDEKGRREVEKKDAVSVVRRPQEDKGVGAAEGTSQEGALTTGLSAGGGGGGLGGPGGWNFSSFPYAYYVDTLRDRISISWYNSLVEPGGRGRFLASVYFRIHRDGSISDLKVEKKSGIPSLDLSALRAVENAAPFPPLPQDFSSEYLGVYFEFEWER